MAVSNSAIIETKYVEDVLTTQYTSPAGTVPVQTIVDNFTVSNSSGGSETVTVHLVPAGDTADASNVVKTKTLADGRTYNFSEVVGHTLEPGDFIAAISSTASTLVLRASGRLLT